MALLSDNELLVISVILTYGIIFSTLIILSFGGLFAVEKLKIEDMSYDQQISTIFANWTFYFNISVLFYLQQYSFVFLVVAIFFILLFLFRLLLKKFKHETIFRI